MGSARIAEKIKKKIGIDVEVKPEAVTEENVVPTTEVSKAETATVVEVKKEETPKAAEAAPIADAQKREASKTKKIQESTQEKK